MHRLPVSDGPRAHRFLAVPPPDGKRCADDCVSAPRSPHRSPRVVIRTHHPGSYLLAGARVCRSTTRCRSPTPSRAHPAADEVAAVRVPRPGAPRGSRGWSGSSCRGAGRPRRPRGRCRSWSGERPRPPRRAIGSEWSWWGPPPGSLRPAGLSPSRRPGSNALLPCGLPSRVTVPVARVHAAPDLQVATAPSGLVRLDPLVWDPDRQGDPGRSAVPSRRASAPVTARHLGAVRAARRSDQRPGARVCSAHASPLVGWRSGCSVQP